MPVVVSFPGFVAESVAVVVGAAAAAEASDSELVDPVDPADLVASGAPASAALVADAADGAFSASAGMLLEEAAAEVVSGLILAVAAVDGEEEVVEGESLATVTPSPAR